MEGGLTESSAFSKNPFPATRAIVSAQKPFSCPDSPLLIPSFDGAATISFVKASREEAVFSAAMSVGRD
jgi:hypothetical protein